MRHPDGAVLQAEEEPALRVCDCIKIAKNQHCKQYSCGDKMVEKSKKSQTLSEAEGISPQRLARVGV
jgi:hypothetical protein